MKQISRLFSKTRAINRGKEGPGGHWPGRRMGVVSGAEGSSDCHNRV